MPSKNLLALAFLAASALVGCGEADTHNQAISQGDAGESEAEADAPVQPDSEAAPDAPDSAKCELEFEGLSPIDSSCGWIGERGPMHDVWGASPNDFYAVGRNGFAMHYDGSAWTQLDLGTHRDLAGVWGTSSSNVFIAGSDSVYRFDGSTWRKQQVEGDGLGWIWGLSECSVFGSGQVGTMQHFDGTSWTRFPTPGPPPGSSNPWMFSGVWGTSDSDLYLLANYNAYLDGVSTIRGKIAHYDGVAWTVMMEDAGPRLQQIWGAGPDDIFAVGGFNNDNVILHFDGKSWSTAFSDTAGTITSIWGRSGKDVYAAGYGGRVLHYDGVEWTPVGTLPQSSIIRNLFGSGDKLWLATEDGIAGLENGTLSFALEWRNDWSLEALGGCSAEDVFAVGFGSGSANTGKIIRREGADWNPMQVPPVGTLWGVWCVSPSDVYAVGEGSTVLHYDGSSWTKLPLPVSPGWLNGVWASSPSEVFAVGENGSIMRGAGDQWELLDSGTGARLRAVWGTGPSDVYAVGDGVLLHYDGKTWSKEGSGEIRSVWGADKDNVFAAAQGSILRREGGAWVKAHTPPYSDQLGFAEYKDITGSSATELFAVGGTRAMTQFDGNKFDTARDFPSGLRSVWSAGPGSAYASGNSNLLRYRCGASPR